MSGFARYANNVSIVADAAKFETKKLKTEEKPSDKDDLKIFIDKLNDCVSNFYISDWCGVGRNNDNSCRKYGSFYTFLKKVVESGVFQPGINHVMHIKPMRGFASIYLGPYIGSKPREM